MQEDSTINVQMLAGRSTFIVGTADGTVADARHRAKRQRAAVKVSEDVLNRQIQDYGLVSPERATNVVWCFFKKYGSKKLKDQDDNLKLAQQALCTICLADQARRLQCTVKLGKDNSPSSVMNYMRIHHQDEYNAVVVANSKGLSLAAFTAQREEPRVCTLIGNSSVRESPDNSPGTPSATPSAANGTGAALHEASMARRSAVEAMFQDAASQEPGAPGTHCHRGQCLICSRLPRAGPTSRTNNGRRNWYATSSAVCYSTQKPPNSQSTNLLGCKKASKMVPPPATAPDENVIDVAKLDKEASPRNTCFPRPLLYTYW
jgi:hypothetical protein